MSRANGSPEGIAIVGIGCRFPGGGYGPQRFWEVLRDGRDAITEMPRDRFDLDAIFDADPREPARIYTRWGGFIDEVDRFDARFFGISPREAVRIDVQHRLLLETVWEALEDAGLPADRLAGSRTGVFVGISTHDYGDIEMYPGNRAQLDAHSNTGTATSIAANRISYLYDFRGPSFIVDTACSSALTAVHLACQSLRSGESTLAVVAGVQLLLAPELTMGFCKASMLSPDGRCRAFDHRANGYVRSEGVGVVVLKPLSAALAERDPIYAVIRGTAINQDGRTNGMTVPSLDAQQAMLSEALAGCGIEPAAVDYVEAHGPGTAVGDPIEAHALGSVLARGRSADRPCLIGSVKTNIGHLEAGSGIAGLIKAALCLEHRQIPASLHFERANPSIDMDALKLRVVTTLEDWPAGSGPAIAGVNSFGFGGANAHVLLEEAPSRARAAARAPAAHAADAASPALLPLSARSDESLRALASAHLARLREAHAPPLSDLCANAARRRAHLEHRLAVVASSNAEMADALDAFLAGESRADVRVGRPGAAPGPLAFVFSGMGPQWYAMGRQLMAQEPVFRRTLERCDEYLRPHADWGLLEELARDEATSRVGEADLAQVTSFAIQAGIVDLLAHWGIRADAVLGHSAGEMGSVYAAGVLTLEECIVLAYHRSRLQSRATGKGRMLAVGITPDAARELLAPWGDGVAIAAINAPASLTLSGDDEALEAIHARLQERQAFSRFLNVVVPYHSAHMDPIRDELLEALAPLRPRPTGVRIVSEVTGDWIAGEAIDAAYWWRNVREPVLFADGVARLAEGGCTTFLEIGAHPVLSMAINECLAAAGAKAAVLPTLRRQENEPVAMRRAAGALFVEGRPVDWTNLTAGDAAFVALPSYPWQRERYWFESQATGSGDGRPRAATGREHPLLGRSLRTARPTWEARLEGRAVAFLDDHLVQGALVYPGAAYTEMALSAAAATRPDRAPAVREIEFHRALFMAERAATVLQLALDADSRSFEVHAAASDEAIFTMHSSGTLSEADESARPSLDLEALRARCPREVGQEEYYQILLRRGLGLGGAFRGIRRFWHGTDEAIARVEHDELDVGPYQIHPGLLDAAFQPLIGAATSELEASVAASSLFLPVHIRAVEVYQRPGARFWSYARVVSRSATGIEGDVFVFDDAGAVVVAIRGLRCRVLEGVRPAAQDSLPDWLYDYRWEEQPLAAGLVPERSALDPRARAAVAGLGARADRLSAEWGWRDYYGTVEARLNALAIVHITRALAARGLALEPGRRFEEAASAEALGIVPRSRRLFGRLLEILAADGALEQEGGGWRVLRSPAPTEAEAVVRGLLADFPDYAVDIRMLDRCGRHLAGILDGSEDAREVLFSADAFPLLAELYRESPPSRFYNTLAAESVAAAVAGAAVDRPLRLIELGAGTGGTTSYILRSLEGVAAEYVFTDVSPFFAEQARRTFADVPFLRAAALDVESAPGTQGFRDGSFDVVVAANVLHATADLAASLANVRRLIAPGGALVLQEITRQPLWLDIVFGLTDGWWRFSDLELRPKHPILEEAAWRALLQRSGFVDVTAVSDTSRPGEAAQTVLVAWRPQEEVAAAPPARRFLVFADRGGAAERLQARLASRGAACASVRPGPAFAREGDRFTVRPDTHEDLARVLSELGTEPLDGILHLWSLDAPPTDGLDAGALLDAQITGCSSVLALVRAIDALDRRGERVWLATAGAQLATDEGTPLAVAQGPLWGLARVIVKEQAGLRCRIVDLGAAATDADLDALALEIGADEYEEEIALRGARRYVRRLRRSPQLDGRAATRPPRPNEAFRAVIDTPGALETLCFVPTARRAPGAGEVQLRTEVASVNFREVMLAMGLLPAAASEGTFGAGQLGLDCSGVVTAVGPDVTDLRVGDEVIAAAVGTWSESVTTSAILTVPKPAALSFADGAQLTIAFVTALYALRDVARLQAGETVLIHSATGGVGLAALQVAREAGATVYATAGSPEKRAYLESLGVAAVMSSRTLDFADEVLRLTGGRGVDVVLNSLAGAALVKSLEVLAPYGRFIEIGKRDIYEDSRIGLLALRGNASFSTVDIDRLTRERPTLVGRVMRDAVRAFAEGRYQPLPHRVFPASRMEEAVRHMAQARHMGKVLLSFDDPDLVVRSDGAADVLTDDGSYLVTGGLGGFGLAVARWLAERGARCLVLVGRSAPSAAAEAALAEIRALGARVEVYAADVSRTADVARVIASVRAELPPLRGIVHAAMVLDDAPLGQLDRARLERVLAPKIAGAWNLHLETAGDPLDFFVTFSSIAALLGNPLQANYAAANAFFEPFVHHRRALGLPALNIAWGVLRGVGYLADRTDLAEYLERQGYQSLSIEQALEVLDALLPGRAAQCMAARIDWRTWSVASPAAAASRRLGHLIPVEDEQAAGATDGSLLARVAALAPEERLPEVESLIRARAARVLGTAPAKVEPEKALTAIGLDSLMAVELMTLLKMDFELELPVVKLLQGMSVRGLAELALERIGGAPVAPAPRQAGPVVAPPAVVAAAPTRPPDGPPVAPAVQPAASGANGKPAAAAAPLAAAAAPASGNGGSPEHTRSAVAPRPTAPVARSRNGTDYSTLDYRRWNASQRILRGTLAAAFRTVADVRAEGLERIPKSGPFILAINHLSVADAPLVLTLMPRPVITFAADYLRERPVMNWFLGLGHAIYVKRGEGDHEALERGLEVLRAGGAVGLGPEGTRSKGGLGQGQVGAAWLALKAGAPVVPLVAWGQERLGGHLRSLRRAPIQVRVGEPLRFQEGEPTARRLQEHTDEIMRSLARLLPPDYRGVYQA